MSKFRFCFSVAILFAVLPLTGRLAVQVFPLLSAGPVLASKAPQKETNAGAKTSIRVDAQALSAKLIHQVKPVYPPEAREKGIEGAVQFEILVDEDGQVGEVQVLSGNALLVSSAYEAVRQWRYEPFLLDGKPVKAKGGVTVAFTLDEKELADSAKDVVNFRQTADPFSANKIGSRCDSSKSDSSYGTCLYSAGS